MQINELRPHDLLWAPMHSVQFAGEWPDWADEAWMGVAPVVVRRETTLDSLVPVGMRGTARNQRSKAYVPCSAVRRCVTPEMLTVGLRSQDTSITAFFAAVAALRAIGPQLDAIDLAWGPTGGVGFFLATGLPVLRADSDLDLLVRAPKPLTEMQTRALADVQRYHACRIDIQIDTGQGAFALAEWSRGEGRVMLKTNDGPQLRLNPWGQESTT
jgi:phosphoribosyl-dephospho-CoA transferase